jgi:replicative DNA helicase
MSEQIARPLPYAGEAEKFVLGAVLSGVSGSESCFDVLHAEDFFLDPHRKIFAVAQKLREGGKQPGLLGINDRMANTGELEAVGGIAYIAALGDGLPRISPVLQWAQLIRDKARLREVVKLAEDLQDKAFSQTDDAADLLDSAIEALSKLAREIDSDKDDGMTYRDAATRLLEELNHDTDAKIYTGIDHLDRVTGGFRSGELVVITAETGVGKTVLAQQTRSRSCLDGRHSLFASAEMLAPHLLRRALATEAGITPDNMRRRNRLTQADLTALIEAASHQCNHCRIIDGELDLTRIRRAARRMKGRTGLDLIVLDYDELITAPGKDEFEQQKNLTRAAKSMAMELSCAVILVSQLRKPLAGEDAKRPTLQRLYGSGAKAKHANIVLLADREFVRDLIGDETSAQIFVLKNRDGKLGRIPCRFDIRKLRFESAEASEFDGAGENWDSKTHEVR